MIRGKAHALLLGAIVLTAAAPAAQGQSEKRAEAERIFRAGERAYEAGQYELAAEAFEKAYETLPLPAISFSAAQAYRLQFFVDKDPPKLKRAIELYRKYIEEVPSGGRRDDATANLAELEPILLRLEAEQERTGAGPIESRPRANLSTRIMVTAPVEGARASIDGGEPGSLPLVAAVEPGAHQVVVRAEGYFPLEQRYDVVEGQLRVIEAALRPRPALVRVRTESGARITVDGRPAALAPMSRPLELEAGTHLLSVETRGRRAWSREITVGRGEEVEIQADLERTLQRKLSYGVLGASALSLTGAGVFALLAADADSDASKLDRRRQNEGLSSGELEALRSAIRRRDDRMTATYALLGVGGALAASGALLWFLDSPRPEAAPAPSGRPAPAGPDRGMTPVSAAPVLSPDAVGLALRGRF